MSEENSELWDGTYEKEFYWLYPPGAARVKCWPNAGLMNATDGSGRAWKPEDRVKVELLKEDDLPASSLQRQRIVTLGGMERERELQRAWHPPKNELDLSGAHRDIKPESVIGTDPPSQTAPTAPSLRSRLEQRRQIALLQLGTAVHERAEASMIESKTRVLVEGKPWAKKAGLGFKRGICKHKFGLAGGFAECSACGVKRDKACTHAFGFAGGFSACPMCGGG